MPITASINVTPDGFCNHDDVAADADFMTCEAALIESADYVVLGRKTYELFAAYWPQAARNPELDEAEIRLARAIDDTPRLVVSRSLNGSDWEGTTILADFDRALADEWSGRGRLIVLGSPSIFTQLSAWDLIDRYHFVIEPFVGGRGARLFEPTERAGRSDLLLEDCRPFSGGGVSLTYARNAERDS